MAEQEKDVRLNVLFRRMLDLDASDLHVKEGNPPLYRVSGDLHRAKSEPLTDKQVRSLVEELLGRERMGELFEKGSLDLGHDFGQGRVRLNIFLQTGRVSLAARLVKMDIPSLDELHLPGAVGRAAEFQQGLVLVCGITGSGKSTTLACLLEMINERRRCHILTIEDPIEYLHQDARSIINQREIGLDCHDWAEALRAAVREDPDVILVGEMRDTETFQAGLIAAETGHLVFGTLHTSSAAGTISRILDLFPTAKHSLIRQSLGFNMKCVLCQKLVPSFREDIQVVPAVELMFVNPPIRKSIEEGEDGRIADLIEVGREQGMLTWTQSFAALVNQGYVEKKVAREYAPNRDALEMALKGIDIAQPSIG